MAMFATGSQANQWLKTHHADVLILDTEAPMMSGSALADMMEQVPTFTQIPLILMSTSAKWPSLPNQFHRDACSKNRYIRPICMMPC
ncbi:MAG: hypothetical protein H6656_15945 [Ardenticatenaceae bacterium]|nr:hypothetical protein [Ardenticatenaceae bacterium]